ncbi:MAG: hypothetical protein VX874_18100 [Pseudomonadota bacterium]|nr:hypothetical protein [Pseudomonadota bacterium]
MRGRLTGALLLLAAIAAGWTLLRPAAETARRDRATLEAAVASLLRTDLPPSEIVGVVRLRDDPERLTVWMDMPDAAFAQLLDRIPETQPHRPRREIAGLPGPDATRAQTHSPWRASYFTIPNPDAALVWLYARPLEDDLTEVLVLAYEPDLATLGPRLGLAPR